MHWERAVVAGFGLVKRHILGVRILTISYFALVVIPHFLARCIVEIRRVWRISEGRPCNPSRVWSSKQVLSDIGYLGVVLSLFELVGVDCVSVRIKVAGSILHAVMLSHDALQFCLRLV